MDKVNFYFLKRSLGIILGKIFIDSEIYGEGKSEIGGNARVAFGYERLCFSLFRCCVESNKILKNVALCVQWLTLRLPREGMVSTPNAFLHNTLVAYGIKF